MKKIIHICKKRISQINAEPKQNEYKRVNDYPNGEITYNEITKEYTAWDETYSNSVAITAYYDIAVASLNAYGLSLEEPDNE